ncbi:MAG: LytR family transcriptional regulator [Clostridiales bacterium]|jgi:LCP family protein required for cell wall assembly|nr:LytR family transcriptional regulator [Clostridiales bacterium]
MKYKKLGVRFMKKGINFILTIIFLIGILCGDTNRYFNLSKIAYGAPSQNVNMFRISMENSNGFSNKWCSDIAPIRKKPPVNQSVPKKLVPKTQIDVNKIKNSGVINIAFFGLDRRNPNESSRSDSIMVISIDEKKQKIKVTSLMRDMYIPIPGKGNNRINSAYAFGGAPLAINTINTNFGLNIKDYVMVDFFGLEKLIDTIGGIKITVSAAEAKVLNIYEEEIDSLTGNKSPKVNEGNQTLNGRQAVAYCRIRYAGHADYERTERQRRVLNEIFRKVKQDGIKKLPKTISTLLPFVKTSLSVGEVLKLALKGVRFKTENIEQYRLPVDGTYKSQSIRGMAVLVPDLEKNREKILGFIYGN